MNQQIVSITSQGQITIPAFMRRSLNLDEYNKASVKKENNKIIIEPIPDFLDLGGSLKSKAQNKPIDQIIQKEEQAVGKAIKNRYSSKS